MTHESPKVLAIDDMPDNLITLKAVLRDALPTARVLTASSGPAGIALARAEDPDVILLDIVMPGMDGFAVCRALKADAHLRTIPVVFLTALRGDQESRLRALEAGAEGFLAKPLDEVELVAQIRAMVKIKAANRTQLLEREQLAALVAERTAELERELAERKRIEETLRESEARYRRLTDHARDIIFRYSLAPEMRLTYINPAVEEITGYSPEACYADPDLMLNLAHPEDRPVMAGFLRPVTPPDKPFTMRWIGKDGGVRWMESRVVPVYDAAGRLVAVEGITRDMTERVQAEAALKESEARHRAIFENMAAACCVDEVIFENSQAVDYRILDVNPAYERITGMPRSQAAGALASALYGMGQAPFLDVFSRVAATGEPAAFEAHFAPINKDLYITVGSPGPGRFSTVFSDITERKQAEEALRESAAALQKAQAVARVGSWVWHIQTNRLEWSDQMYRIFGFEKAAFTGDLADVMARAIHPDDRPAVERSNLSVMHDRTPIPLEYRVIWPDGTVRVVWAEAGELILDAAGTPLTLSGIVQDITERKEAEVALQESERRFRHIADTISDIAYSCHADAGGGFALDWMTGAAEPITGYTASEILAHGYWRFLVVDEDIARFDQHVAGIAPGASSSCELRLRRKDGEIVWVNSIAECVADEAQGDRRRLYGGLMNITERKQTEEALRERENMLQKIFDILPIGLWFADKDGRLQRGNPAGVAIWGAEPKVAPAEYGVFKARRLPSGEELAPDDWALSHTIREGVTVVDELLEIDAFDGKKKLILNYTAPVLDEAGAVLGAVVVNQDVTERVRAEDRLRATLVELQRSNADLERFVYIASHDLQEPLRMVASYAQLLSINYRGRLDADADEFIGYLVEGAMRMQQLLLDLLDYSSINTSAARPQPTDAALSYEMALNSLEPQIAETAATLTCDPLPTVLADPAQLTQIFEILIGNAIKFRGAEPPVVHISARAKDDVRSTMDDVRSTMYDGRSAHIEHRTSNIEHRQSEWVFAVRDNGIGIEPQYFERIFIIFQRLHTRRKYQGNGIGLAICKRIIERHGGRIWVESQPGQGSTFYFTLKAQS